MKQCVICDSKIRKGISLTLTKFNNSETQSVSYDFCPRCSPSVGEFFRSEIQEMVNK